MKTATVAILASCLLGQALAAPVHAKGAELPAKAGDLTKDIKIDDLKSALKDIAQEARAVRYGTPAKRGDDKVKDVLSALGIDAKDLDKKTVKLVEKGINDLTDASKTPLTRMADLSNMVQVLQPYYKKTTVSKRSTKELDTLLGKLGVDAKDVDKKTLKKIEDKVKEVADKTADPIVRAGGLGDILGFLGPLLAGAQEQTEGVTDTATGLAGGAAGNVAGNLPAGNLPVKRLVDGSILKNLFNIIGLEVGDEEEGEDAVKGVKGDVTDKAGGLLDSVTKNLPGGLGSTLPIKRGSDLGPLEDLLKTLGLDGTLKGVTGKAGDAVGDATDKLPIKRGSDLGPIEDLLKTLGLDGTLKGVTGKAGDAVGDATDKLPISKRQLDLAGLLSGLLGLGGDDAADGASDTASGVTDTAGSLLGSATGAVPGLGKRQVDDLAGLLGGLLGGGDKDTAKGATDAVGSTVGGLTDTAGGLGSGAVPGLGKRQLDDGLGGLLEGLLGGGDDEAESAVDTVGSTADSATGGLTAPLTGAAPGLGKRQLDGVTGLLEGLLGGGEEDTTKGATDAVGSTVGSLGSTASGLTGAVPGLGKRQLDSLTGLVGGLTGGGKGQGNPLDAVTGTAGGLVDTVGSTADSLTGGATAPLTSTAGGLADSATGLASGAAGSVPGLGKRQLDSLTGLVGGLTGGGKGQGNPLDAVTGTAGGLVDTVGSTADSLTGGATAPLTSTAGGLTDTATGLASGAAGSVPGLGKRQLDAVTGLLSGLTGGSKGGNPLDAVTGTAGGLVDSVGSTADSLTGGATAPLTSTAGDLAGTAGGLASGAAGAVPGVGKRMAPGSPDLAALLQALGPVLEQLKGAGQGATGVASGVTDAVDEVAPIPTPIPTPAAAPKAKRQEVPGAPIDIPAPEDIIPADLPTEGTEPLTVIFDDLSEVSTLLPQVGEAVPEADALRETIDKFLASLGSLVPEGAAPEAPLPVETPAAPVALP